jgi:O-antigen/teichoic acid export membrane protein
MSKPAGTALANARAQTSLTSIISRVFSGATGVLALTTAASILVRTVSSLVLTRLLTPSVFGLVGIITSIFFTISMITDLGFESFIVRHARGDQRHFRNVIWTIHAGRGIFLAALGCSLAPAIAWALQKHELLLPLACACLTLAINGFASFSLIVALKAGRSRKLSVLELVLQVFQTTLCICLALYFRNVWAFIASMIAQSLLRTTLSYVLFADSAQQFATDRDIHREFFAFSKVVLSSSLLTLLIAQSDKFFLAKVFTLGEYGLYAVALNLATVPIGFVAAYVSRIVFPMYTRTWLSEPAAVGNIYYSAMRRTAPLYAFGVGGLIGAAPLLVAILYDKRYLGAGLYLSVLAIGAALRLPTLAAAEMMTAIGRIKVTLYLNILRVVWLGVALPVGFWLYGALGVIFAVGLLELPALLGSWVWLRKVGILKMRYELAYLAILGTGAFLGAAVAQLGLHVLGR